jgi:mannose-6-phosphate isomerase-like protein (cupin superfamily)
VAEQAHGADAFQRPLRARFRAQLMPGVRLQGDASRWRSIDQSWFAARWTLILSSAIDPGAGRQTVIVNGKETEMTTDARCIVHGPGEGEAVFIPDGRQFLFKTVSTDTRGAYSLGEFVLPPAGAALPHIHWENEEAFYVLDGEFTVGVGEQSVIARTGSFILVPRGTVHSLHNTGTTPGKLLFVISPAGMERMFVEIGQILSARDRPPDRAAIQAIRDKYRTQDVEKPAF